MSEIKTKIWKGRKVIQEQTFDVLGTFESLWAAEGWLKQNGFSYGSSCREMPIAIRKGEYDLPQKWKNFESEDESMIDGVLLTSFREGPATILIFEPKH